MDAERPRRTPLPFVIGLNCYIAAFYTNIGLPVGGVEILGVLGVVGAIFMFRRDLGNLIWLWSLIFFLTVSLVFGGSGVDMFDYRLPSWIQLVAALTCAHILLHAMDYPDAVRKTLLAWMVFITVGVVLETLLPAMRDMSDAFRQVAYDGRFIYESGARDLRDYGFMRPNLFTQEPSHISKAFIVFGAGWCLLSPSRKRFLTLLGFTAVLLAFLRSPFVLLALPLAWILDRMTSDQPVSRRVAVGIPLLGVVVVAFTQVFSARLLRIANGEDYSFFLRYQAPYEVALRSIEQYPVFGVGIGAKEALLDEMRTVFSAFLGPSAALDQGALTFNNGFANMIMFFGLVGTVVFYFLVVQWAKGFGVRPLVTLSVVSLFLQNDVEGIRVWTSIALILGCYVLAKRYPPDRSPPSHQLGPVRATLPAPPARRPFEGR
jgi:hypothetical protein